MTQSYKKKEEKVFPPTTCSAAVGILEGVKDFSRAQHQQALDAVGKVEGYLSDLQSGVISEDKSFRNNYNKLTELLLAIR